MTDITLDDVQKWCGEKFSDADLPARADKLIEEMVELGASNFMDVEEMADIVIVLCHIADWHGQSLMTAIQEKHRKNLARTWVKNERGSFSHVVET
jgi:predicted house-cleaning noncanonical NTP pyrophosphatase (MazG superfamily)